MESGLGMDSLLVIGNFTILQTQRDVAANNLRYGTYSTTEAISAGLDLEMPGPTRWRTITLSHAVSSGKLEESKVDARVRCVLSAVKKASKSGIPPGFKETVRKSKSDQLLLRKAATDSVVLLMNDEQTLPLQFNRTVR